MSFPSPTWDGDAERQCDPRISGDTHIKKRQGSGDRRDESGSLVEEAVLLKERVEPQNRPVRLPFLSA